MEYGFSPTCLAQSILIRSFFYVPSPHSPATLSDPVRDAGDTIQLRKDSDFGSH